MNTKRLGTKIAMWFAGMMVILILLLCAVIGFYTSKKTRQAIGNNLASTAVVISTRLDQFMWSRSHELEILLAMDKIRSGQDYSDTERLLNQLKSSFPAFSWIGLLDTQGNVRAATGGILCGQNIAARPVFSAGIRGNFIGDVHEAVLLARALPNPTGEPLRFVDISKPIFNNDGRVVGVLASHLNWNWADNAVNSITDSLPDKENIATYVISKKDKQVLLGPTKDIGLHLNLQSLESTADKGWILETWPDGQQYLTGFTTSHGYEDYPGLGWIVLVRQPVKTAYASIMETQLFIIGWGFLFTILCTLLIWLLAKKITTPLNQLSLAASKLRQGERIPIRKYTGFQEVEMLEETLSDLFQNLNSTKTALDRMETKASTDMLTTLPNRAALKDYLTRISTTYKDSDLTLTIFYIDLDNFKTVNDTYGHQAGDTILKETAARLKSCIRTNEIVARLGGDEFVMVLHTRRGKEVETAQVVAARIFNLFQQPIVINESAINSGCSIGCAIWPQDGLTVKDVLAKADTALYVAKTSGKNRLSIYQELPPAALP